MDVNLNVPDKIHLHQIMLYRSVDFFVILGCISNNCLSFYLSRVPMSAKHLCLDSWFSFFFFYFPETNKNKEVTLNIMLCHFTDLHLVPQDHNRACCCSAGARLRVELSQTISEIWSKKNGIWLLVYP